MTAESDAAKQIDDLAQRVDDVIAQIQQLPEPARQKALELKSAIEAFHKDGLTRIVRSLKADPRGKELLLELVEDAFVFTLFAMHGIVRTDAATPAMETPAPQKVSTGFVPLGDVLAAPGWKNGPAVADLTEGKAVRFDVGEKSILLLLLNGTVQAFRNECAHQGLPLDGGMVDKEACTITCPWHGFRYDATTGECLTAPQAQLERVEMKIERDRVQVRIA